MAHHDNRDWKEDPVAKSSRQSKQSKMDADGKTYNNAGSLWIDCTKAPAMMAGYRPFQGPKPSSRCSYLMMPGGREVIQ